MALQVHTIETAPEKSAELLKQVKTKYGFIPNLMGVYAESPETLQAYLTFDRLIDQTTLTPLERQIALIGISVCNNCDYCVAAHTSVSSMQNLPDEVIQAVRDNRSIADSKLETLRRFVQSATDKRGLVSKDEIAAFLEAGYTKQNLLEIILIMSMKVLSNYISHIAETPLDEVFKQAKWEKAAA